MTLPARKPIPQGNALLEVNLQGPGGKKCWRCGADPCLDRKSPATRDWGTTRLG